MITPFLTALLAFGALVALVWVADVFWMLWMRLSVVMALSVVSGGAGFITHVCTGSTPIAIVTGFVVGVLIVRIGVDAVYWLYDITRWTVVLQSPLAWDPTYGKLTRMRLRWPVLVEVVETPAENKDRLEDLEPLWGYFRERMRLRQQIIYRDEFEPDEP